MKWNTHENNCAEVVDNLKNYSSKFPSMWLVLLWPKKCWELIFEPSLYVRSRLGGVSYCSVGLVYSISSPLSLFLEDLLLNYLGDFFSLGVPGYGRNKKPKGKQGCCRWVDILSSCFHVVWQEVNRPPPPHPSSPCLLPSHRRLMMFAKDRLQSWGVPRKKDCFDLCWTSQQPWSLGSCLFLRIPSLWWCLDTVPALLTGVCLTVCPSSDSNTPYWNGSLTSLNFGLGNWEWKHFSFEPLVLYETPQGKWF